MSSRQLLDFWIVTCWKLWAWGVVVLVGWGDQVEQADAGGQGRNKRRGPNNEAAAYPYSVSFRGASSGLASEAQGRPEQVSQEQD